MEQVTKYNMLEGESEELVKAEDITKTWQLWQTK